MPLKPKHQNDCDRDCQAEERGLIVGTDGETSASYIYFMHDTYGDGHWKGAYPELISGPYVDEVTAIACRAEML